MLARRRLIVVAVTLLLGLREPAWAEPAPADEPSTDWDEVVVTASVEPLPRGDLTNSVSVIGADEIDFLKYDNVAELLGLTPGVHVEQPGSRGGRSSIYLRGLDPNQTIVMVDGVRLGDPNNSLGGSFDLSTLDADNVERIEIVRGPISAVHGSDAIAGAVNVITKRGLDGDSIILDASGGRFGYGRGLAIVRGARGPFDLSLSGSYVDAGKPRSDNTYRSGNVHASLGVDLPRGAALRSTLRYVDADSHAFPEASGGEKFAVNRERERRRAQELSLSLALDQDWNEKLSYEVGANYYRRREKRDTPAIAAPPGNPFARVPEQNVHDLLYRTRLNTNATYRLWEWASLTGGGDVTFESGNSLGEVDFGFGAGPMPGHYKDDRIFGGPFIEANVATPFGLIAQAGVRADFSDEDDTEWTPRVGASYPIPCLPVTVRGSWGRGFKLPAFFSKSDPIAGNPDLASETSEGWDVGFEARFWDARVSLTASYFEIEVDDLIDFDFAIFQLVNRNKVTSKGVEVGLLALLPWDLVFRGSLTHVQTNIKGTREDLRRRPRWRTSADLQWTPHERVELGLTSVWVSGTFDESNPTGKVKLDDYVRFDLRGEVRLWREVSFYLAIENLFDSHYEQAVGVPATGIRPRAGLRAVF
jgi:vitamin B12 transporter